MTSRRVEDPPDGTTALPDLAAVVLQSPHGVVITERDGTIVFTNTAFQRITGYDELELIGENPRVLQSGKTSPEEYARLWRNLTAGESWHGELLDARKGGELYWTRLTVFPLRDEAGEISHYVGLHEDRSAARLRDSVDKSKSAGGLESATVAVSELRHGWFLDGDVLSGSGVLIIRGGHELNPGLLARLRELHRTMSLREPLKVRRPSPAA